MQKVAVLSYNRNGGIYPPVSIKETKWIKSFVKDVKKVKTHLMMECVCPVGKTSMNT